MNDNKHQDLEARASELNKRLTEEAIRDREEFAREEIRKGVRDTTKKQIEQPFMAETEERTKKSAKVPLWEKLSRSEREMVENRRIDRLISSILDSGAEIVMRRMSGFDINYVAIHHESLPVGMEFRTLNNGQTLVAALSVLSSMLSLSIIKDSISDQEDAE